MEQVTDETDRQILRLTLQAIEGFCHVQLYSDGTGATDRLAFFRAGSRPLLSLFENPVQDHRFGSDREMANDFIKLKKLTSDLQTKMQEYASKQTRGGSKLTDEDVINLIINMMNGMIDWTIDFVSKQNQSQGQGQMQ